MMLSRAFRLASSIMRNKSAVLSMVTLGFLFITFNIWNVFYLESKPDCHGASLNTTRPLIYAAFGRKLDSGYLEHVFTLLERAGYVRGSIYSSDWNLLWSYEYPFRVLKDQLVNLPKHKKVNHFPGSGYITNKVNLATSGLPHVPVAFKIPQQKAELVTYAKKNPDSLFVQKSNNHRGIKIQPLVDLDLETPGTFVQEYVRKPLLIDGHKFDIGVYTIITSIAPLRVYIYDGDILFRFCPEKYHPFDVKKVDKYVIGDDYLPIWNVSSLKPYYSGLGFGMKESFNAYLLTIGKDPKIIWQQIDDAIRTMLLRRELSLASASSKFASSRNFFEMIRVDFVVDEDLNVFIMEANMSPNLSSQHFPPNRLMYEQVIFNVLKLIGIIPSGYPNSVGTDDELLSQPEVAFKDLVVFPDRCAASRCANCSSLECKLCKPCLTESLKSDLTEAFKEHTRRHVCRRVVPPSLMPEEIEEGVDVKGLTEINQLMHSWFHGKCLLDNSWC
ncbi:probable tubulin polyglutamylase ttll-15 [Daphnia pulicaria]|uniref:probable tubulin polyglutamylase ttll-15 n=1 Tax=Daphnia pulicaria TaxID=35523 RepID=UPI001EEC7620|nr:probable tubulin polyglutamylase ttll-15 [Daphnia pulicaria]XP_046642007.1 probable tubulin polyglutamylase ttll-15 [Daphnia pulicaria]